MAKRIKDCLKHISYCAGKDWEGTGTKDTSPCPFGHSAEITAKRYVCNHCANNIKPNNIIADANGIYLYNIHEKFEDLPTDIPVKRKRGRPRKHPLPSDSEEPKVKRKRGRPRKHPLSDDKPEPQVKRKRGRPRKIKDETAIVNQPKRKRGRPRKNPIVTENS